MAAKPIVAMAAASAACSIAMAVLMAPNDRSAVLLGIPGPLAAAVATWMLITRTRAHAPERVTGVIIKLFAAKFVLVGAYVTAVLLLLRSGHEAFALSFTFQYVVLHLVEAIYLRRLDARPARAGA